MSESNTKAVEEPRGRDSGDLLAFFKALSDESRLRIVALLARQEMTVEQTARYLGLTSSTASHHLARLSAVGLVTARAESYYSIYRLVPGALSGVARRLLREDALGAVGVGADSDVADWRALGTVLDVNGRIKAFPVHQKARLAVLRHVVRVFETGRRYPEKHVNRLLSRFMADTARLRRELVEGGFLERQGGSGDYWRAELTAPPRPLRAR